MYSLQYETKKPSRSANEYPALQRWSDVVFLNYYDHITRLLSKEDNGKDSLPPPKHIFMHEITTPTVQRDMDQLESKSGKRPPFPGTKYGPEDDGFKIFSSTVHGKVIVWFLMQHKLHFGDVAVVSISALRVPEEEKNNGYNLV